MLARNPDAYDGKLIRVEALGLVSSSPTSSENWIIVVESGCAAADAWATVNFDPDSSQNPEVDEFVNSRTPEIREARVVIDGYFDERASLGCFSPRFGINNANVRFVSPVTSKPRPSMSGAQRGN